MISIILKKIIRIQKKNQKGATAVEFAIVLLLFITILFAIIEFGLLMFNQHIVTNAGREGARAGIVFGSDNDSHKIINIVELYGKNNIVSFGNKVFDVSILKLDDENGDEFLSKTDESFKVCKNSGDPLTIQVQYNYDFLFFPFNSNLSSLTNMRCE